MKQLISILLLINISHLLTILCQMTEQVEMQTYKKLPTHTIIITANQNAYF